MFKENVTSLVDEFMLGKLAVSFTYSPSLGKFLSLSFHEIYSWDGIKEDVYISVNVSGKTIYISNATATELKDAELTAFMGMPSDFMEVAIE